MESLRLGRQAWMSELIPHPHWIEVRPMLAFFHEGQHYLSIGMSAIGLRQVRLKMQLSREQVTWWRLATVKTKPVNMTLVQTAGE